MLEYSNSITEKTKAGSTTSKKFTTVIQFFKPNPLCLKFLKLVPVVLHTIIHNDVR